MNETAAGGTQRGVGADVDVVELGVGELNAVVRDGLWRRSLEGEDDDKQGNSTDGEIDVEDPAPSDMLGARRRKRICGKAVRVRRYKLTMHRR